MNLNKTQAWAIARKIGNEICNENRAYNKTIIESKEYIDLVEQFNTAFKNIDPIIIELNDHWNFTIKHSMDKVLKKIWKELKPTSYNEDAIIDKLILASIDAKSLDEIVALVKKQM